MNRRIRQVIYFLSSRNFSDGLRITVAVLLPSLVLAQFDQLQAGLAMSLGALNVSVADTPGPVRHRRNAMLITALLLSLVTLITGFARMNVYTLGVEILLFSFLFSMFAIWGNRATSVGTAALLIMILMLDRPLNAVGVVQESGLVLAGSLWYATISLLASRLQPYRVAQQTLGQCIHEIAKLMVIKADFYSTDTKLEDDYRHLIAQQVVVSEKQDAVREILFKSRSIMTETTRTGRLLVLTFTDVVDLYEQIIALFYDYASIRDRFGKTGVLDKIAHLIRQLANELDQIGLTVQLPFSQPEPTRLKPLLDDLKQSIDALGDQEGSTLVLKKVLVNLRNIRQRLTTIRANLTQPIPATDDAPDDDPQYGRFVSHQEIDLASLRDSLTTDSLVFRHSVRVALAMLLGFVITKFLPYGHYSYWMLLTIAVILKPAFSLTKQRNGQRIIGTLVGGVIGVLVLTFVPNQAGRFVFMVLFMLGTYSAQRVNYQVMVICLTPFVLIMFSFLGVEYRGVVEERIFDTLLGGVITLVAGYAFFPQWESEQLLKPMQTVLQANVRYTQLLLDSLSGSRLDPTDYRLARKDIFVTSANLGAAFDRMLSEPKHTQRNERYIYQFVVLNHVLSANIATILSAHLTADPKAYPIAWQRPIKRALHTLTESLHKLDPSTDKLTPTTGTPDVTTSTSTPTPDDETLLEQLDFIHQISSDIGKLVERQS